jgi:DNA replication licensing factor MCM3
LLNNASKNNTRLNINMDELRQFNARLAQFVVKDPIKAVKMFQDTLNANIKNLKEEGSLGPKGHAPNEKTAAAQDNFPTKTQVYYVNFEGNFGRNHVTPRGLRAELLNNFVSVTGIVTRMSIVKPRLQTSVHYCEETKRGHCYDKDDKYNIASLGKEGDSSGHHFEDNNGFRTKTDDGKPLSAEYGYCIYRDYQEVIIQELPERAPPGQLPRSVRVILTDDLVDRAKPGDRVQVNGVFRANMR